MNEPWKVPESWRWTTMGEIAEVVGGGTPRTNQPGFFGGEIAWITPADLSGYTAKTISRGARNITEAGLRHSGARLMPPGTVLFSSRAPIGYVAIAANRVSTNQGFKSFVLRGDLLPDYVYYYLRRARDLAIQLSSGTTFLEISGKKAAQIPIPVPPPDEQHRIVGEIEKQLTRLEAGVTALKRVQANLKRYYAAVLKAACEGRLVPTEAELARREDRPYEPASVLLGRISAEEARVAALPRRGKRSGEGVEALPPDLPPLPEGWCYTTVGALGRVGEQPVLTGPFGTNLRTSDFVDAGVPVVTISCLTEGGITLDKAVYVSEEKAGAMPRYRLAPGDFLFSRMASVGRAGLVPQSLGGALFNYHLMRLRLEHRALLPGFYLAYVRGAKQVEGYVRRVNHGATRDGINTAQLLSMPVALPPAAEQQRIVSEVERRLSLADELDRIVSAHLHGATRLRQSILAAAFSGHLGSPAADTGFDELPMTADAALPYWDRHTKEE